MQIFIDIFVFDALYSYHDKTDALCFYSFSANRLPYIVHTGLGEGGGLNWAE